MCKCVFINSIYNPDDIIPGVYVCVHTYMCVKINPCGGDLSNPGVCPAKPSVCFFLACFLVLILWKQLEDEVATIIYTYTEVVMEAVSVSWLFIPSPQNPTNRKKIKPFVLSTVWEDVTNLQFHLQHPYYFLKKSNYFSLHSKYILSCQKPSKLKEVPGVRSRSWIVGKRISGI